ncbi:MAG: hypothetical protein R3E90_06960 [Marinicella sp.]|nr:hypothetical protein [Xanthomonadales bacterium]
MKKEHKQLKYTSILILVLLTFMAFSAERPTITSYYESIRFPYDKKTSSDESLNKKQSLRQVSYKKRETLDFEVVENKKIYLGNDFEKRNCGSQLAVLNEILKLMEDLINNGGVDPESPIIGSIIKAATHAFKQLMFCIIK